MLDEILHYTKKVLLKNPFFMFLSNFFFVVLPSKIHPPRKHWYWWRCTEDVLSTSRRNLQYNFFCLPRRLEEFFKTSSRPSCKAFWKRLEDVLRKRLEVVLRRFEDFVGRPLVKMPYEPLGRQNIVTLNASLKCLEDVLESKKYMLLSKKILL